MCACAYIYIDIIYYAIIYAIIFFTYVHIHTYNQFDIGIQWILGQEKFLGDNLKITV